MDAQERHNIVMLLRHWLQRFSANHRALPDDYMVLDLETSGFNISTDLILNVGYAIVEDRRLTSRMNVLLDWTRCQHVDQQWLRERIDRTRQHMEERGAICQITYEMLSEQGENPFEVLHECYQLIEAQQQAGYTFVMHNGYAFDAPRLKEHFRRWLGIDMDFGPNQILDTGAILKAAQTNSYPDESDTLRSWSLRAQGGFNKGVKWSLGGYALPTFLSHHNLDVSQAHGAGFDAYAVHLLIEEFRRMLL